MIAAEGFQTDKGFLISHNPKTARIVGISLGPGERRRAHVHLLLGGRIDGAIFQRRAASRYLRVCRTVIEANSISKPRARPPNG